MNQTILNVCTPDAALAFHQNRGRASWAALLHTAVVLAVSSALYGASFGLWRDPQQALFAAIKMPVLFLGIVGLTGIGNTMAAQVLGVDISLRQTLHAMLVSFAVTTLILAALAPVFAFAALTAAPPADDPDRTTYATLLATHTFAVAIAGTIGNLRLWKMLRTLAGTFRKAALVSLCWFALCGAAGSELSWICSPFLARPDQPVVFLNPNAFRMNMYEYLWHQLGSRDFQPLEKCGTEGSSGWKR